MGFLSGLLGPVADLGKTYLSGKNDIAKAKQAATIIGVQAEADVKVAGVRAANKLADNGQTQSFDLDLIAMQQMDKSYLDDFMILIVLAPVVMAFTGFAEEVKVGFEAFSTMPDWFQYLVIAAYIVKLGLRGMFTKLMSGKFGGIKLK